MVIRTLTTTGDGRYRLGTGGGITVHSDVESEYAESLWKAERLLSALSESPLLLDQLHVVGLLAPHQCHEHREDHAKEPVRGGVETRLQAGGRLDGSVRVAVKSTLTGPSFR